MKVPMRFGISVHTRDGHAGNLERLVVATDDVQPLLLALYPGRALSRHQTIAVPVSLITGISPTRILIAASLNELAVLAEHTTSDSLKESIRELKGGAAAINAMSQPVGTVQGVLLDSDQCIVSHLMVRHQRYHMAPQNRLISTALMTHIAPDAVHLSIAAKYDPGSALTDLWWGGG